MGVIAAICFPNGEEVNAWAPACCPEAPKGNARLAEYPECTAGALAAVNTAIREPIPSDLHPGYNEPAPH